MNLLIDLGNTRLKWALAHDGHWHAGAGIVYAEGLRRALDTAWNGMAAPDRIVVASVAGGAHDETLRHWISARWPAAPLHFISSPRTGFGLTNSYHEPARLGCDRWAALVGARRVTDRPLCVVDCGTAVTLDALSVDGVFIGGVILPGLALARQSLLARAPGIRETDGRDASCFARNTADGVAAGTLFGLAGAVERIVHEFSAQLGHTLEIMLTGGDAAVLRAQLEGRFSYALRHEPELVLKGLAVIAETLA
jgi:type III pantothenate kinase